MYAYCEDDSLVIGKTVYESPSFGEVLYAISECEDGYIEDIDDETPFPTIESLGNFEATVWFKCNGAPMVFTTIDYRILLDVGVVTLKAFTS